MRSSTRSRPGRAGYGWRTSHRCSGDCGKGPPTPPSASDNPIGASGHLLAGLPGLQLLDSLAVDGEGWVCVGTLGMGFGGVTAISPDGSTVDHYAVPDEPLITNICFGGDDLRTAYLTSSGKGELLKMAWPRPGLALAFRA